MKDVTRRRTCCKPTGAAQLLTVLITIITIIKFKFNYYAIILHLLCSFLKPFSQNICLLNYKSPFISFVNLTHSESARGRFCSSCMSEKSRTSQKNSMTGCTITLMCLPASQLMPSKPSVQLGSLTSFYFGLATVYLTALWCMKPRCFTKMSSNLL